MARKALIEKEKRRAKLVKLKWEQRQELKKKVIDPSLSHEERQEAMFKLSKLPRNSVPVRQRARCQLTGRPRGNLRKFGISRICFREMASNGLIPGVFKASW